MHTPNGRGPAPPDVGAKLNALQRAIEHVDRKFSSIKIPPSTGGGIAGQASVPVTTASIIEAHNGTTVDDGLYVYGTPYDPNAGRGAYSGVPVSQIVTGSAGFFELQLVEGWYHVACHFDIGWSNPANSPESALVVLRAGAAVVNVYDTGVRATTSTMAKGFADVRQGMAWVTSTDLVSLAMSYSGLGVSPDRGVSSSLPRIEYVFTKFA